MNQATKSESEYSQESFIGGMNLFSDDTHLQPNQYRIGFDLTNRKDSLDPVLLSKLDPAAPAGIKQELVTFGNYIILFVAGKAYYRYYTATGWTQITGFSMSTDAPRFWTVAIPVAETNYLRIAATATGLNSAASSSGGIQTLSISGAAAGNIPGLLVQDNINQPQFIFIDSSTLKPTTRVTQIFEEWSITFTDADNTVVATDGDKREYVPVGNVMSFVDGILYIASQDGNYIYRSVSGRPLDFVVNVTNLLVTADPYTQVGGGDATTTSYSVGTGPITCLRPLSTGGLFVAAGNANFAVTLNKTPNAPTIFGEYRFIRTFLFNATCLSDRTIFDTLGDTRFIELTGIRSFNAIQQLQNEGRNSLFSSMIQGVFGADEEPLVQDATKTAGILYNNYELYAVNTIFGACIAKFDTLTGSWTSFDRQQTGGKAIKMFAKIELTIMRLYAITEDDQLYTLYISDQSSSPSFRTLGITASILQYNGSSKNAQPNTELKIQKVRAIINEITEDSTCSFTPFVNNRKTTLGTLNKDITYEVPDSVSNEPTDLDDVNTQISNLMWATPDIEQGWKCFGVFSWSGGSLTQFSVESSNVTPQNPFNSQGNTI